MSFLTPAFLLLGLLALPIILMYMLRLRRREVAVSSTLLWQKLLRDREANAPWQKLRRNWLLILQLLILALLVLALARPFFPIPSVISGNTVVLLDASASMQAHDVAPNRFAAAQAEAQRLINNLSAGSQMTLIQVGHTPEVLAAATSDKISLRRALDNASVENGPADWGAALALAAGAAQGFRDAQIVIISDGGLPPDLPPLPATPIYLPIGESGENLAIAALATRATAAGPQLFAAVSNSGAQERSALLSLELDGLLYDSRRVNIPAGGSANLTWQLPAETAVITARLSDHTGDYLALDDVAYAVHEGGVTNRALLVTEGNLFLEQLFSVLPGIETFKAGPDSDLAGEIFDLYVYDGVPLPNPLPQGDLLIINPPPQGGADLFSVSGVFSDTVATRLADSPLLQFVDWRNVHVRQARQVDAPWARPLVEATGGPLILTGERAGQRIALFTFDLRDSDLPLQIAFPVLMANITGWLSPGRAFDAPSGLQPGDAVTIAPAAGATAVLVEKPDSSVWTADVGEEATIFPETGQLGLYQVRLRDGVAVQPAGSFAVNLFNPAEAAIQPASVLSIGPTEAENAPDRAADNVGQRELWPWLALLALFILGLEWWVYHRGLQLPKLDIR